MSPVAPQLVGLVDKVEAQEFFAEIAFVEFAAQDDFVGGLELRERELPFKERRDGVGVGELRHEAFMGVFYDARMVIGEIR